MHLPVDGEHSRNGILQYSETEGFTWDEDDSKDGPSHYTPVAGKRLRDDKV